MTEIARIKQTDEKHAIQRALDYRLALMGHLSASIQRGNPSLKSVFHDALAPMGASERDAQMNIAVQAAMSLLPNAEIVLWRGDLRKHADAQAEHFADAIVTDADLPNVDELWFPYLHLNELKTVGDEQKPYALLFELLLTQHTKNRLSGKVGCLRQMGFCFPLRGGTVMVDEPPQVTFEQILTVGERPDGLEAQKMLSCLTFRASRFVDEESMVPSVPRPERRRMEKAGIHIPIVRIVNLRRREQKGTQKETKTLDAPSQHHCQWWVRPHVRRPNHRMKEQHPIWVDGYIKGPPDKPFKAASQSITVVKR